MTVVTVRKEAFARYTGTDPSLESQIDSRVAVVRTPFQWPTLEPDVRRWPAMRALAPRLWSRLRNLRDRLPFPEVGYGPWRRDLERSVHAVHRSRPVDLTIATANPNVSFAGAAYLWRRYRVPYVMDYRDAWLLDVFSGDRLFAETSRAARTEARLVGQAEEVWFVNDEIRDWHRELYTSRADRMHTVMNGFDPAFAPEGRIDRPSSRVGLRFGYIGTVTPKVPMAEFVAGWRAAASARLLPPRSRARIHGYLGYYGEPRADVARLLDQADDVGISYQGPADKASVSKVYADLDVLLLILGAGRYVTSGKVFEYLASGLPIVSVHDPDNAASRVLADYPLWFPASSLDPDDVARALGDAARAAASAPATTRCRAVEFGRAFSRRAQLDPRIEHLSSLTEAGTT